MTGDTMTRAEELQADRALWGLDEREDRELQALLREAAESADPSWERAAAAMTVALLHAPPTLPSPALMERLRAAAPIAPRAPRHAAPRWTWASHFLGAAAVMLAAILWFDRPGRPQPVDAARQELLRSREAAHWSWTKGPSPLSGSPQGDVVWSDKSQKGYMRFRGLPPNESGKQYQLWIVDAKRPSELVDGGLFDIPKAGGDVIIPIDAKLPIAEAKAFVLTLEPAGGVVVSKQTHVIAAAKPK